MIGDTFDFFPDTFVGARSLGCLRAYCTRCVDGDTYDFTLDLGITVRIKVRVRLKDFDTAELFHPRNEAERLHADQALAFVSNLILDQPCLVRTYRTSSGADLTTVGRYVADVYYRTPEKTWRDLKLAMHEAALEKRPTY